MVKRQTIQCTRVKRYQRDNQKRKSKKDRQHKGPSNSKTLYCLSFFDLRLLSTPLVSSNSRPLHCLSFFDLRLLIISVVSSNSRTLYCLSFFVLRLLSIPLVSSNSRPLCCLSFFVLWCRKSKDSLHNGQKTDNTMF
jgi:hypothetical protein